MIRKRKVCATLCLGLIFGVIEQGSQLGLAQPDPAASSSQVRNQKEVRHELLLLPYFTVFDNIAFQVQGDNVTLMGEVTQPVLKSDAEIVVKHVEGVEQVVNKINVLPPTPMDNQSRVALYRAIYGFPSLEKYAMGVQKC